MTTAITTDTRPAVSNAMLHGGRSLGVSTQDFYDKLELYPEEHRETPSFWFETGRDRNWSLNDLFKQTGVSTTTLTRLFRGMYEGDVPAQISKLAIARTNFNEVVGNPDFILTSLARKMFEAFDKTRALRNVTIMWGPMGIGKTTIINEYKRQHGHGQTFVVRCPGHGCSIYQFITHVAKSMRVSMTRETIMTMRDKIGTMLGKGHRILILDELHEVFRTCNTQTIIRICEWLREVQEIAGCGLALTGTELLHKEFFHGVHKDVLAQLVDRGTVQIPLNAKPTKGDITAFLKHYGLPFPAEREPEAASLLNDIIRSHGLRKLTLHLRDGQAYANRRQETYTWDHFTAAFEAIARMSSQS